MEAHEDHNNPQFDNDVALITVTEPFDFSDPNVQPIEMLMNNTDIPAETICNSTGKKHAFKQYDQFALNTS